jgi:hypothetical protein
VKHYDCGQAQDTTTGCAMSGDELRRSPDAAVRSDLAGGGRLRLRRRRRHLLARRVAMGVAVAVALVGVFAAAQLYLARDDLTVAREDLVHGVGTLAAGRADEALAAFAGARRAARSAEDRLTTTPMRVAGALPGLGRTVRTSSAVAEGATLVAEAGQEVAAATVMLPDGLVALAPRDGRIPVETIAAMAPALTTAHALVAEAERSVADSPATGVPRPVADARGEFLEQLEVADRQLETAAALARALPAFLGADGPRRYFFGAQNPAELRGTGGFIGAYTVLTIEDGRLDFGSFQSIVDLSPLPVGGVKPPTAEYRRLWGWAGGAGFGQNANMTADVPSAAIALQRLYERVKGDPLDGTILADPHAFAALLRAAGPVDVEGVGEVSADTVVDQVANEAYGLLPDSDARKELLGQVASATLARFLSEGAGGDPARAAEALVGVAAGGRLRIHADDPDVAEAFDIAGVTGRLAAPGDLLAVVGNNAAQNKVDFYTDRHVSHEVWLEADGDAVAETTVRLVNDAPTSGLPLTVIGPNVDYLEAGENRTLVSVYCGRGCVREHSRRGTADVTPVLDGKELGYTLVATRERYASGEQAEITHRFRISEAWDPDDGLYRLRVLDQPTIRPTTVEVRVHSPDGLLVRDASPGMAVADRAVTWTGRLDGPRDLTARFGRPAQSVWQRFVGFLRSPAFTIG